MEYKKLLIDKETEEEFPYDESFENGKYYYQISVVDKEKHGELQIKPSGCNLEFDDGTNLVYSIEPENLFPGKNRLSEVDLISILYQLNAVPFILYPQKEEKNKSVVTLRFFGETLIPEEISRALGCEPTRSEFKGQVIWDPKTECEKIAKTGSWRLEATDRLPENLDSQISELLTKTTHDLTIWKTLSSHYETDLFCGFFMGKSNEEFSLSPESLASLGNRGIILSLDIYVPGI